MIRINLIADRRAKDKAAIRSEVVMGVFVFVFSMFICFIWWQSKASAIEDTNLKISKAKVELKKQKRIREQVKNMEAKEKSLKAMIKTIGFLNQEKQAPVAYLDNLNVILPSEIWIVNLTDRSGSITINGFSFSNNSVADLMRSMQKSIHFMNVELSEVTTAKVQQEALKKFKLTCMTRAAFKRAEEEKKKQAANKKKKKRKGRRR